MLLPDLFRLFLDTAIADGVAASVGSMSIYILMASVLGFKPNGLFPAHS